MKTRMDRISRIERLLFDEARAARLRADAAEGDARRDAARATRDAAHADDERAASLPSSGPIAAGDARDRARLDALHRKAAASARGWIAIYAGARATAREAADAVVARAARRRGVESIAARRAVALAARIERHEEGVADDLANRRDG